MMLAVSVGDNPPMFNAYYNKRGSGGVCIALATTIIYVKIIV